MPDKISDSLVANFGRITIGKREFSAPAASALQFFNCMKNATGEEGKYGALDYLRFNVLLPLKSIVGLTAEEAQQKALYDTASKVKAAATKYFTRLREIPLEHKTATINEKKKAYFNTISLEELEQLQDVRNKIEKDPKIGQARLEMLSGFREWMELAKTGAPSDAEFKTDVIIEARQWLLDEIDDGRDGDNFLQAIRMEYAYTLLTPISEGGAPALTIAQFIDHFENLVKGAVAQGIGSEKKVREDFIRAAAYVVNRSTNHKEEVETYFNNLQNVYNNSKVDGKVVEAHFKSEIDKLIQSNVPITATADVLESLSYENETLQGRPISLREFFPYPADFEEFVGKVEQARNSRVGLERADKNLEEGKKVAAHREAVVQQLTQQMNDSNIRIETRDLSSISLITLSDNKLKEILGDTEAQKVINQRDFINGIENRISHNKKIQDLKAEGLAVAKTYRECIPASVNGKQKSHELEQKLATLQQDYQAAFKQYKDLGNIKDVEERLEKHGDADKLVPKIKRLKSEIETCEAQIKQNKAYVENLTKLSEDCKAKLRLVGLNVSVEEARIRTEVIEEYKKQGKKDPIDQLHFNVSKQALLKLQDYLGYIKDGSSIKAEITYAIGDSRLFDEATETLEAKQEDVKALTATHSNSRAASNNASAIVGEDLRKVFQEKLKGLCELHQLSIYKDKLFVVSSILTATAEQDERVVLERDQSSGRSARFEPAKIKLTDTEQNCQKAVEELKAKIETKGLALQLSAIHASKHLERKKSREEVAPYSGAVPLIIEMDDDDDDEFHNISRAHFDPVSLELSGDDHTFFDAISDVEEEDLGYGVGGNLREFSDSEEKASSVSLDKKGAQRWEEINLLSDPLGQ